MRAVVMPAQLAGKNSKIMVWSTVRRSGDAASLRAQAKRSRSKSRMPLMDRHGRQGASRWRERTGTVKTYGRWHRGQVANSIVQIRASSKLHRATITSALFLANCAQTAPAPELGGRSFSRVLQPLRGLQSPLVQPAGSSHPIGGALASELPGKRGKSPGRHPPTACQCTSVMPAKAGIHLSSRNKLLDGTPPSRGRRCGRFRSAFPPANRRQPPFPGSKARRKTPRSGSVIKFDPHPALPGLGRAYFMRKSALVLPLARKGFIQRGAGPRPLHSSPEGPRYLAGCLPRGCLVSRLAACAFRPNNS